MFISIIIQKNLKSLFSICYEKIYEINLAKKHYNEALKIKPDSELIKQRLQDMQKAQESIFEYKENKI